MKSITLQELAEHLGGKPVGDGALVLTGVASLEAAGPGEISFFGDPKLKKQLAVTKAGALIIPAGQDCFAGPRIEITNPYLAFARTVAWFNPVPVVTTTRIHPSAVIDDSAELVDPVEIGPHVTVAAGVKIGKGTRIGPGCTIGVGSTVGEDCLFHGRVSIYHDIVIGDRVEIHAGSVVGSDGFGYAMDGARFEKFPQVGRVVLEDDVELGANCAIDRGALGDTLICRGVKLDNMCHIAHNVVVGDNTAFAAQVAISGSTKIGRSCMVGGQSGFAGHATIGDRVEIGARSGIRGNLPDGTRWFGSPAQPMRAALRNHQVYCRLHDFWKRLRALENAGTDK